MNKAKPLTTRPSSNDQYYIYNHRKPRTQDDRPARGQAGSQAYSGTLFHSSFAAVGPWTKSKGVEHRRRQAPRRTHARRCDSFRSDGFRSGEEGPVSWSGMTSQSTKACGDNQAASEHSHPCPWGAVSAFDALRLPCKALPYRPVDVVQPPQSARPFR